MEKEAVFIARKLSKKLNKIRVELKVGKGHRNDFGKFNYRSSEDIMGAAKPLLNENDCLVTLDRQVFFMESAFFIESTASFFDGEALIQAKGYARIPQSKAGMDDSQVTGSATSYADKYALQALFLLDDGSLDPDGMNNDQRQHNRGQGENRGNQKQKQSSAKPPQASQGSDRGRKITSNQRGKITYLCKKNPQLDQLLTEILDSIGSGVEDLTFEQAEQVIAGLKRGPIVQEQQQPENATPPAKGDKITANLKAALLKAGYSDAAAGDFIAWGEKTGYSHTQMLDHLPGMLKQYEDGALAK